MCAGGTHAAAGAATGSFFSVAGAARPIDAGARPQLWAFDDGVSIAAGGLFWGPRRRGALGATPRPWPPAVRGPHAATTHPHPDPHVHTHAQADSDEREPAAAGCEETVGVMATTGM